MASLLARTTLAAAEALSSKALPCLSAARRGMSVDQSFRDREHAAENLYFSKQEEKALRQLLKKMKTQADHVRAVPRRFCSLRVGGSESAACTAPGQPKLIVHIRPVMQGASEVTCVCLCVRQWRSCAPCEWRSCLCASCVAEKHIDLHLAAAHPQCIV